MLTEARCPFVRTSRRGMDAQSACHSKVYMPMGASMKISSSRQIGGIHQPVSSRISLRGRGILQYTPALTPDALSA